MCDSADSPSLHDYFELLGSTDRGPGARRWNLWTVSDCLELSCSSSNEELLLIGCKEESTRSLVFSMPLIGYSLVLIFYPEWVLFWSLCLLIWNVFSLGLVNGTDHGILILSCLIGLCLVKSGWLEVGITFSIFWL